MAGKQLPPSEQPEGFDDEFDDVQGDDLAFTDQAGPMAYPQALSVAARYVVNMDQAARDDVQLVFVSAGGRVQVIGSGQRWPSADLVIIEGPCIAVYGRDAKAEADRLAGA